MLAGTSLRAAAAAVDLLEAQASASVGYPLRDACRAAKSDQGVGTRIVHSASVGTCVGGSYTAAADGQAVAVDVDRRADAAADANMRAAAGAGATMRAGAAAGTDTRGAKAACIPPHGDPWMGLAPAAQWGRVHCSEEPGYGDCSKSRRHSSEEAGYGDCSKSRRHSRSVSPMCWFVLPRWKAAVHASVFGFGSCSVPDKTSGGYALLLLWHLCLALCGQRQRRGGSQYFLAMHSHASVFGFHPCSVLER